MKAKLSNWFWLGVEATPVLVPAVLAVFGAVATLFLLLNNFNPAIIWPLGLLAAIPASITIFRHYPREVLTSRSRKVVNLLVIIGVVAWGAVNIMYTSQHVLVNRDPALYANAGAWLTNHDNLRIPTIHTFGNVPGVLSDDGSGFKPVENEKNPKFLYAQGAHLLPAFIGLVGRAVGFAHALHINVIFGMSALLAMYAFGRELVRRSWWAAVATGAIAVSMPMINFTRDSYSEPLAMTFTLGALAMIWLALKSKKLSLWFIAGLVAGAGTMTRIDSYLTVAEVLAFLVIMLALGLKSERLQALKQSVALVAGLAVTTALGWLDLSMLSPAYFHDLDTQFHKEVLAIIAIIILGAIVVVLSWRTTLLKKLDKSTKAWRSEAAVIVLVAVTVLLVSRPLWVHTKTAGIRTYAELSTDWVSWYIGAALAVLGVVGLALSIYVAFKKRKLFLAACLLVIIGTALIYLVKPNIYPDQIWASRRLMPVILPGVAVFGAVALDYLSFEYMKKINGGYILAGLASAGIILAPLVTSIPMLKLRPFAELGSVEAVCNSVPKNAAILWLGDKTSQEMTQPTRGICGIPAQRYHVTSFASVSKGNLAQLAHNAMANGKVPIVGVYSYRTMILPDSVTESLSPVSAFRVQQLEHTLTSAPQKVVTGGFSVNMGKIQPDGSITPLGQ